MNNAIEIKELSLSIEGRSILNNISFSLGEICSSYFAFKEEDQLDEDDEGLQFFPHLCDFYV